MRRRIIINIDAETITEANAVAMVAATIEMGRKQSGSYSPLSRTANGNLIHCIRRGENTDTFTITP